MAGLGPNKWHPDQDTQAGSMQLVNGQGEFVGRVTAASGALGGMRLKDPDAPTTTPMLVFFPTADPAVAGAWWDNAGTLTKSTG